MKKVLLFVSLTTFFIESRGQISLLSSEMLPFGAFSIQKSVLDLSIIDTTIQGADKLWNFASIQYDATVSDMTLQIVNPSSTPYAASFPNSNYCYKEITGTKTNYRYFNLTSTLMERVGSYVNSPNVYSNPQTEYVFPTVLGSSNKDTWASTNSSSGGTYDLKCIGTGTLSLPSGTFNAILVRVQVSESFLAVPAYYWYSVDNGAPLLSYIAGYDGFFDNDAFVLSSLSLVGLPELDFATNIKYVNPFTNELKMSFNTIDNQSVNYKVTNVIGEIMSEGKTNSINSNEHRLQIDMTDVNTGIYFLTLISNSSNETTKTIKLIKY